MADNVAITSGTGTSIATDDIGGVQYQRVKISQGADGSATDVSSAAPLNVTLANTGANATAVKVDNSAVTQPISAVSLPLPSGAATAAKQPALGTAGTASTDVISVQGIASMTALKVDGSAVTQPVSAATLPLPSGASTAAKQPALGTAGTASTDVITVQGIASMTALKVDGSAVTQPVSISGNQAVNVAQINGVAPLMGAGNTGTGSHRVTIATDQAAIATAGQGATGSAVPSGATYKGLNAATALPSAATAGNLTGAMSDKFGRQVNILGTIRDLIGTQTTTISASTSETTIVTAAASTFLDLTLLVVSNTSTATNTRIDFRDTTAGSVLFSLQSNGGQPPIGFSTSRPIPQTSVNTNWTAQCATSTTDVRVYAVFEKNK